MSNVMKVLIVSDTVVTGQEVKKKSKLIVQLKMKVTLNASR